MRQGYATLEILRVIRIEWELSESRFYVHLNEAKKTHQDELQEQKKELEAIRLTEVKKAAQKGLKSKFERDLDLQNDIEYYQDVLSSKIKTTFILRQ